MFSVSDSMRGCSFRRKVYCHDIQCWKIVVPVEPLMNDLRDERPPGFYDRFSTDRLSTLYRHPLTNDHPANAASDRSNLN